MSRLIWLPTELLVAVIVRMGPDDAWNFGLTCKHLMSVLLDETVCRKLLEGRTAFGKETMQARCWQQQNPYSAALRIHAKRNHAIATAQPFAVAVLADADSFILMNGMVVYSLGPCLRILNLRARSGTETMISLQSILHPNLGDYVTSLTPLHYAHGILSVTFTVTPDPERPSSSFILILSLREWRVLSMRQLTSLRGLFVRNNHTHLCCGAYGDIEPAAVAAMAVAAAAAAAAATAPPGAGTNPGPVPVGPGGPGGPGGPIRVTGSVQRWSICVLDLRQLSWCPRRRVLPDVLGPELGKKVDFAVFDDSLYMVSSDGRPQHSLASYDESCYYGLRMSLTSPSADPEETRMFRRVHRDGPIDDRWTSIRLEMDQVSGQPAVCEVRREWVNHCDNIQRACYRREMVFPPPPVGPSDGQPGPPSSTSPSQSQSQSQSPSVSTFPSPSSAPSAAAAPAAPAPPSSSVSSSLPPATPSSCCVNSIDDMQEWSRGYAFTETFLRYYHTPTKTFIDLVRDNSGSNEISAGGQGRLHLRTISAHQAHCSSSAFMPFASSNRASPYSSSSTPRHSSSFVSRWPAPAVLRMPARPSTANSPPDIPSVDIDTAMDDEGSALVYSMNSEPDKYQRHPSSVRRPLILISFDPSIYLPGLRAWSPDTGGTAPAQAPAGSVSAALPDDHHPSSCVRGLRVPAGCQWAREEPATYRSIGTDHETGQPGPFGYNFAQ